MDKLSKVSIPAGPIYNIADIYKDSHYREREMFLSVPDDSGRDVVMPGVVPKLSETPGRVQRAGPICGAHTEEVLVQFGFDHEQIKEWLNKGVIDGDGSSSNPVT
jgi:formyl-CoA transferase